MQRLKSPPPDQVASFLNQVDLFRDLPKEQKAQLGQILELVTFQKDEVIYKQNAVADAFYIIRTGSVGIFMVEPKVGLQFETARLRTSQVFGEITLLTGERHHTTAKSIDRTACFRFSGNLLRKSLHRIPEITLGLASTFARRLDEIEKDRSAKLADLTAHFDAEVYRLVPARILEKHRMIPLRKKEGVITIACVDAQNLAGLDEVRRIIRTAELNPVAIREDEYHAFLSKVGDRISRTPQAPPSRKERVHSIYWHTAVDEDPKAAGEARGDEVKDHVDRIVAEAIEKGASDIHLEPYRDTVDVRYRVSGRLVKRARRDIPRGWHRALVSRIKVLAELDISERRRPQDGRISCTVGDRTFDIRLSTMPTHDGEKVVMRVLDSAQASQPLEQLILAEKVCRVVQKMLTRPYGVIYVCGPTGSGKTTTLYSSLGIVRGEHTNITTVEDPIEYNLPGIIQVNVKPEIGLSFATMLRSILRQDPNIILVGETRDSETGQLVIEAGLTGHLVLTSLHTNDAIGTIQRLREMSLENFAIAASLIGVISQRLVRRLCPACSTESELAPQVLDQLAQLEIVPADFNKAVRTPKGCDSCDQTGFLGRVGAYEILVADDELRQQIMLNATQFELRATAYKGAYVPLSRYSNYLLTHGITTAEEVLGVCGGSS